MKSMFRLIFFVTLIFGVGTVAGTALNHGLTQRESLASLRRPEDRWLRHRQEEYAAALHLSPEQLAQMQPAFEKTRRDLRATREQAAREVRRIMGEHYRALCSVLTPEQLEVFQHLVEERITAGEARRSGSDAGRKQHPETKP
jgi:Spy/CpxP family protein refolding chaperone